MATYLHGIVYATDADEILAGRRGDPALVGVGPTPSQVRAISHRKVAALVSDVLEEELGEASGVRGLRRDLAAHSGVLNTIVRHFTVVPVRFGVVLPGDDALVQRVLRPQYASLQAMLARLDGAIEVSVKAAYVEDEVLREVVREQPALAGGKTRAGGRRGGNASYEGRIDLGRRVAAAVAAKRQRDSAWLVELLRPVAREVAINKTPSELAVLHASFLVDRARLRKFDERLDRAAAETRKVMGLDCVGPLPPYSFAAGFMPSAAAAAAPA